MAGVRKVRGREFGRETTRKGGGRRGTVPFSVARLTRSCAPKFPLPLLTPATQAQPRPQGFKMGGAGKGPGVGRSRGFIKYLHILFPPHPFFKGKALGTRLPPPI